MRCSLESSPNGIPAAIGARKCTSALAVHPNQNKATGTPSTPSILVYSLSSGGGFAGAQSTFFF